MMKFLVFIKKNIKFKRKNHFWQKSVFVLIMKIKIELNIKFLDRLFVIKNKTNFLLNNLYNSNYNSVNIIYLNHKND